MRIAPRDLAILDEQYANDLFIARAFGLAGYVLLIYELVDAIPDEVQYIWPTRWSIVKAIYLGNRYGNLVSMAVSNLQLLGLWRSNARPFCFQISLALSLTQFASFASIHILVLLRAWATWGRHVKILALLVAMFFAYAVVSITFITYGVITVGYDAYPLANVTGTCVGYLPDPLVAWIIWLPSLLLEAAIFTLTMVSIRHYQLRIHLVRNSSIIRIIVRDGVLYFVVTLFCSLFNIFVWRYYYDRPLNMLGNNFTLCLMIVVGQRLVLDLRKVSSDDTLSTTRVGREVERAIEAMPHPRSRESSPIVFADRLAASPESTALRLVENRIDNGRVDGWMSKEEERRARQEGGLELETLRDSDGGTGSRESNVRILEVI
ncbi:hypothetical protein L227DRAFT_569020 [Lentinus tigrinus ALCF2SS1-6]|uniref:DUF6533 domain-containing protein n=1 Tax=Lentinus tigrinus ALCF2SS1-6 TaxID=1328759 RepID=A0A5C2T3M2_9APHY|nr:hypothetical protein L227DRAFT_569020 [Lentinus tigrinus ALCF2SS1-6]